MSHMATFYCPLIAHMNEELASESYLDLMLTQHLRDEDPNPQKVRAHLEVDPPLSLILLHFLQILAP